MRRVLSRAPVLLCAAAIGLLGLAPAAPAAVYPTGFEETAVTFGLTQPTAVAWAPDGRTFIAEKPGTVRVIPAGQTAPLEDPILDIRSQVNEYLDRGLLGLALDSDFANPAHNFLYLVYVHELQPLTPDGNGAMVSKLVRYRVAANNTLSERTVLLGTYDAGPCPSAPAGSDCMPADSDTHSVGTVRSAPDRTLWLANGDAASYSSFVDPLALRTYDESSLAGKLIHVGPDGTGLAGHAFCPGESNLTKVCTKLHAKGFRNPFRFTLVLGESGNVEQIALGDVGWNDREELDMIPAAPAARSYGWPCWEGTVKTPYYRDDPVCEAQYALVHEPPVFDYPHRDADGNEASRAALGGPVYTGDQFPAGYRGSFFFADYGGGFIRRLVPTGGGGWAPQDFTLDPDSDPHTDGHGWYGVDVEQGPDGSLYFTAFGNGGPGEGALWRIEYSPGNGRPVADIDAAPLAGPAPLTVNFDASGSTDPDNDALSYEWDFDDGSPDGSGATVSHEFAAEGQYTVTLTADDGRGKTDTVSVVVTVGSAPTAQIAGPATFRAGIPVTLTGSATDPDDGPLPESALDWQVRLIHGSHTHFVGSYPDTDTLEFTPRTDHDADSHYEVTLTATDSDGLATSAGKQVNPETARLLLESSPPGAPITYGGLDRLAPVDRMAAVGFASTITAAESFLRDGHTYVFDSWATGGPRSQAVTIPVGGLSLLARYAATDLPPPVNGNTPDTAGPTVRLQRNIARLIRRGLLSGSVSDPNGVGRVDVGLAQVRGKRCRWWRPRKGLTRRASSCARPSWMRARISGSKWTIRLRGKVPAGRYRIALRARDRAGHESKRIVAAKLPRR